VLKQRIITAAVLVPLMVLCVLKAPSEIVALVFAIIVIAGAWEWGALLKLTQSVRILFLSVLILTIALSYFWLLQQSAYVWMILAFACLLWLVLIVSIMAIQRCGLINAGLPSAQYFFLGLFLLAFAWLAALSLHSIPEFGPTLLLYVFGLVWLADAGAYFAGRQWGKDKLASNISPGKTWQGLYGALAITLFYALVVAWYFDFTATTYAAFVILSLVVVVFSVFGDLFESLIKRRAGVKDSGQLLPGHGGVLDRIDSLLAALPAMAFGLTLVEFVK